MFIIIIIAQSRVLYKLKLIKLRSKRTKGIFMFLNKYVTKGVFLFIHACVFG